MGVELSLGSARLAPLSSNRKLAGLTVAVVGCGYWGAKHVRVLSSLRGVAGVIVVDPDPRARTTLAAAFPAVEVQADLRAVLDRVDAVIVATPPRAHAEIAAIALRAGRHVLIEKPLATSLTDARSLVEEATARELILMVGHTFEFNPAVRELRRRMDSGELGEIQYIHSARLNLGLFRSDVNVVWDLAPHDISIMNYLLRSTPTTVRAWGSANVAPEVADLAYFQLEYRNPGVVGYGHVSWLDPRKVRQVTVVGSRKMALYDDLADERLRIFDRGIERGATSGQPLHERPVSYRYGDIVSPHINFQEPLVLEVEHFIECILSGERPLSGGASGVAVIKVLEAIDRSLASGHGVDVEEPPAQDGAGIRIHASMR
jgi:predicted dehydrogenase